MPQRTAINGDCATAATAVGPGHTRCENGRWPLPEAEKGSPASPPAEVLTAWREPMGDEVA